MAGRKKWIHTDTTGGVQLTPVNVGVSVYAFRILSGTGATGRVGFYNGAGVDAAQNKNNLKSPANVEFIDFLDGNGSYIYFPKGVWCDLNGSAATAAILVEEGETP